MTNFYCETLIEFKKIYNNFYYLQENIFNKKLNFDSGYKTNFMNNPILNNTSYSKMKNYEKNKFLLKSV